MPIRCLYFNILTYFYVHDFKSLKSCPEEFYKKVILKNTTKFTGKICAGFFFIIKLQAAGLQLHQKETAVFPSELFECFYKSHFLKYL